MSALKRFMGKTVVVTGASSGIGEETARRFWLRAQTSSSLLDGGNGLTLWSKNSHNWRDPLR